MSVWVIRKSFFVKSIVLCTVLFFVPLYCMDGQIIKSVKPAMFLTEDIVRNRILPYCASLEQISRLSRTCKTYQSYCDFEKIVTAYEKSAYFFVITSDYSLSTRILAYFAQEQRRLAKRKRNNDAQGKKDAFECLWNCHKKIRNNDLERFCNKPIFESDKKMEIYRKWYGPKKVKQRLDMQVKEAINSVNVKALKILLQKNQYNVFEVFSVKYGYEMSDVVRKLCIICNTLDNDVDIIFKLIPTQDKGYKNRIIPYFFEHGTDELLCVLFGKRFISKRNRYEKDNTALHFAACQGLQQLVSLLLIAKADVHAVNSCGREPIEYASNFQHCTVINMLLKEYTSSEQCQLLIRYAKKDRTGAGKHELF